MPDLNPMKWLRRPLSIGSREQRSDESSHQTRELLRELDHFRSQKDRGFLLELDYACQPRVRTWSAERGNDFCQRIIATGEKRYQEVFEACLAHIDYFAAIPSDEPIDERCPWWKNPWFPSLDAICLTALIIRLNPNRYVEIGSGNSTKFVRRVISTYHLRTKIVSIDPHPRAVVDDLCDEVIRRNLEDCDISFFSELGAEDLLFVDDSHRSFQNSDVTVFFTEVVPSLRSGCHYGIHDIFLPNDYPQEWLSRYYNEQYLLMSYLLGGAANDEIVMPVHYAQQTPHLLSILEPILRHPALDGAVPVGGSFWMKKS
ncbi:MAG TPA: class I SAM-dependent methyltransferase [Methylocella sp.]|nr:class I SAM-dependent methyltransferase [Methylocella sp.]